MKSAITLNGKPISQRQRNYETALSVELSAYSNDTDKMVEILTGAVELQIKLADEQAEDKAAD